MFLLFIGKFIQFLDRDALSWVDKWWLVFFILLCIPARIYLLPRIFEEFELTVLDGSPEEVQQFVEQQIVQEEDEAAVSPRMMQSLVAKV